MSYLLIWGAGGHGKVVLDIAAMFHEHVLFIDDSPSAPSTVLGRQVYANLEAIRQAHGDPAAFLIAIGSNTTRAQCYQRGLDAGLTPALLVHPTAVVSQFAELAPGTVVMPNVVVNASAVIGVNCILNTSAVVEHDCRVGNHVHLSPAAVAGGAATIEDFVHIGIGGVLLPKSRVGRGAVVGAGAVVLHTVADQLTVVGAPARPIHSKSK